MKNYREQMALDEEDEKSLEKELEGRCRWLRKQKKPKVGLKF